MVVEAKDVKAARREPRGKVPVRAVDAHGFVAERVAKNDAGTQRRFGPGRVVRAQELLATGAEHDGNEGALSERTGIPIGD